LSGRPKGPGKPRPPKGIYDQFFLELVHQGVLDVRPDGSIWRLQGRLLGGQPYRADHLRPDGYRTIWAQGRTMVAHRLVWLVFRGPIPPEWEVNHRDLDRANNRLENLEALTASANQTHAYQNPDRWRPIGEQAGNAKLTASKVREARRLWSEGATQGELARRFGVERSTMRAVLNGVTWRHV
jgi:hypothetical protein